MPRLIRVFARHKLQNVGFVTQWFFLFQDSSYLATLAEQTDLSPSKSESANILSLVVRKPVFGVSDQVPHKPGCSPTENCQRLKISDLDRIHVAKTKALISCAVTAQLICVFDFAYAKKTVFSQRGSIMISCDETHLPFEHQRRQTKLCKQAIV